MTLDATYYKVRIDGVVRDCATLIATGSGAMMANASSSVSVERSPKRKSIGASF